MIKFIKSFFIKDKIEIIEPEPVEKKVKIREDGYCNCEKRNVIEAKTISAKEYFEQEYFKEQDKFKFNSATVDDERGGNVLYNINLVHNEEEICIKFCFSSNHRFCKKACLTCKTCLGWFTNGYNHYSMFRYTMKKISSPKDFFDETIQHNLDEILKEEADRRLAKEICGV